MRLLVYEFITGGGLLNQPLPESLAHEGNQMLQALVADLSSIASIDVVVTRDARLPMLSTAVEQIRLEAGDDFPSLWKSLLREVDAVWPIAPESDGQLERLCDDVLKAGCVLLNSGPECVNLAASKRRTLIQLAEYGIPVVPGYSKNDSVPVGASTWVVKPDDGAGCEGIRLFDSLEQARLAVGDGIIQPYLQGESLSLSLICHQGKAELLSINRQQIRRTDDTLKLDGCIADCSGALAQSYLQLASDIVAAMPGLWGYAGVDLLHCDQGIKVVEVNPRLTTSYAMMPRRPGFNPAQKVLDLLPANQSK